LVPHFKKSYTLNNITETEKNKDPYLHIIEPESNSVPMLMLNTLHKNFIDDVRSNGFFYNALCESHIVNYLVKKYAFIDKSKAKFFNVNFASVLYYKALKAGCGLKPNKSVFGYDRFLKGRWLMLGFSIDKNGCIHNYSYPKIITEPRLGGYIRLKKRLKIRAHFFNHNFTKGWSLHTVLRKKHVKTYVHIKHVNKFLLKDLMECLACETLDQYINHIRTYMLKGILYDDWTQVVVGMHDYRRYMISDIKNFLMPIIIDKNVLRSIFLQTLLLNLNQNVRNDALKVGLITENWYKKYFGMVYGLRKNFINKYKLIVKSTTPGTYYYSIGLEKHDKIMSAIGSEYSMTNYKNCSNFFQKKKNIIKAISKHYRNIRWIRNNYLNKSVYDVIRDEFSFSFRKHQPDTSSVRIESPNNHLVIKQKRVNPVIFEGKLMDKKFNFREEPGQRAMVYEEYKGTIRVLPDYQLVHHNNFRNKNDRYGTKDNLFSFNKSYPYQKRLLWVNKVILIPIRMAITVTTNSYDVVHSWFVPGLGLKLDCVPGRATHHTIYVEYMGYYYGQCAEVCGRRHHHMPIKLRAIPFKWFEYWWKQTMYGAW